MMFSPHSLATNLTPSLLKTRKRFETMSAGSTTDTEGGISPLWECELVSELTSITVIYSLFIIIIIYLIYIALFKVLKDTLHVMFIHRRHSYREKFRVKCLAQGHID